MKRHGKMYLIRKILEMNECCLVASNKMMKKWFTLCGHVFYAHNDYECFMKNVLSNDISLISFWKKMSLKNKWDEKKYENKVFDIINSSINRKIIITTIKKAPFEYILICLVLNIILKYFLSMKLFYWHSLVTSNNKFTIF